MIIQDLDGNDIEWQPGSRKQNKRVTSKLQQKAVEEILMVLPGTMVLQEVAIPIRKGKTLYLDIYLPRHKVAVEVMGAQHGKARVSFFHTSEQCRRQTRNDKCKKEWCELNNIPLVYFEYNENPEQWKIKLRQVLYQEYKGQTE